MRQVLSVCPKATARQSITYVWNLYLTDRPSSVPQQLVRSFVSAWHWEFHVQLSPAILLAAFLPVSAYFGAMTVDDHLIALRMRFSDLKWEDATAILFKKWMEQTVVPLMMNLLDEGRAAMENYIYLLSVLFNMRFKFQNALLLALDRSTLWLRDKANVLGQRSNAAQTLILYTFSMLAHDFNRVFVSMVSSDRESTSRFLGLISAIPDVSSNSARDLRFQILFTANARASASAGASLDPYTWTRIKDEGGAGRRNEGGDSEEGKTQRNKKSKKDKDKDRASKGAGSQPSKPSKSPPPGSPTASTTYNPSKPDVEPRFCFYFNSAQGCNRTGCAHKHEIPPKDSAGREAIRKFAITKKLQLSPEFLKDE